MSEDPSRRPPGHRVLIAGGGVAGIETALALADLAPRSAQVSLVAPDPDFVYKPLLVEEPFTGEPPPQFALKPLLADIGTTLIRGSVERVDCGDHKIELPGEQVLGYDLLVMCLGGLPRPAYSDVVTFSSGSPELRVDDLIEEAWGSQGRVLSLVVPPGTSWPLPLYELALMFRRRSIECGRGELRIRLMTPESGPLMIFGTVACDAVRELLKIRRIEIDCDMHVIDDGGIASPAHLGEPLPRAGPVVSLPTIEGPSVTGLPSDPRGFLPIDDHCRVIGADDVYAAGDGTTFPVKQGGLATQQADAAAEHIAARLGATGAAAPFTPILRGTLLTGMDSLYLRHQIAGGGGEGEASLERLWAPTDKISGRYLSKAVSGVIDRGDVTASPSGLAVDVSLPHEWHAQPFKPGVASPS